MGGPDGGQGGRQSRLPVVTGVVLAAVLLGAGAGTYVLVAHPFRQSANTSGSEAANSSTLPAATTVPASVTTPPTTPPASTPPTTAPPTTPAATEQQAATSLSGLLSQSSSDRNAIQQAYNDVDSCGPNLSQDEQTFQGAASSRQNLLNQLHALPGASSLPPALISALNGAWTASMQVDKDYGSWAFSEYTNGCVPQDHNDMAYAAAEGPNTTATADKTSFVSQWNPLAQQYSLPSYDQDQL
jgi:hypothetical protein